MNATNWRRAGDDYAIGWGNREWTLDASDGRIGLRSTESGRRVLALSGIAAAGRREDGVFRTDDRVGVELLHGRILATYSPRSWHGLTVRAAWGPSRRDDGLDLEIQATTTTVGELRKLEILVETTLSDRPTNGSFTVEPRDRTAAALSYDGRESAETLRNLITAPVPAPSSDERPFGPLAVSTEEAAVYVETAHPHDVSRRIVETTGDRTTVTSIRSALFGCDLEKGVVLRGRIRSFWLPGAGVDRDAILDRRRRFLEEPPPLSD